MSKKAVAIEGATITITSAVEGIKVTGTVVVDSQKSKPSEKVLVDGKGAYFGNLHCTITGVTDGIGVQNPLDIKESEIIPSSEYFFENGGAAVLVEDKSENLTIDLFLPNEKPHKSVIVFISVSDANQPYLFTD